MSNSEEIQSKVEKLKEEIRTTPYHKGTEHHIGRLKARIAVLEDQIITRGSGGGSSSGLGFAVKHFGNATIVLVGFPSVGKSTILNALTSAQSKIAPYPFSTLTVIPGMMNYQGAQIQILDVPGLITGAAGGKGRGKQVLAVARNADLILIVAEANHLEQISAIKNELQEAGVKVNQNKPKILISETKQGGIKLNLSNLYLRLSRIEIEGIASEFKITNAEITFYEDVTSSDLIDAFLDNRVYLPALNVINKIDNLSVDDYATLKELGYILISAQNRIGLEELKSEIWKKLNFMRIYLKPKDGNPDFQNPLILKKGQTVLEAADKIHKNLSLEIKEARVWGKSAKHEGQIVSVNHALEEGDVLTISS